MGWEKRKNRRKDERKEHGIPLCEITHPITDKVLPPRETPHGLMEYYCGWREKIKTTKSAVPVCFPGLIPPQVDDGAGGWHNIGGGLLAKALFLVRKVPSAVYSSIKLLLLFQFLMHTRQERRSDPSSFNCFLLNHTTQVLLLLLFTRQRISSFFIGLCGIFKVGPRLIRDR